MHSLVFSKPNQVINVDEKYLYDGKTQQWGPQDLSRQWLTRIEYLPRSPYEVKKLEVTDNLLKDENQSKCTQSVQFCLSVQAVLE